MTSAGHKRSSALYSIWNLNMKNRAPCNTAHLIMYKLPPQKGQGHIHKGFESVSYISWTHLSSVYNMLTGWCIACWRPLDLVYRLLGVSWPDVSPVPDVNVMRRYGTHVWKIVSGLGFRGQFSHCRISICHERALCINTATTIATTSTNEYKFMFDDPIKSQHAAL